MEIKGSFASRVEKARKLIVLYRAVSKDGVDFYAYIRCSEMQFRKMRSDYRERKSCEKASDYGEVLYTRLGKEPDQDAKDFLDGLM